MNKKHEKAALSFLPLFQIEDETDFIIGFDYGANWEAKRSYNKKDIILLLNEFEAYTLTNTDKKSRLSAKKWFEKYKQNEYTLISRRCSKK